MTLKILHYKITRMVVNLAELAGWLTLVDRELVNSFLTSKTPDSKTYNKQTVQHNLIIKYFYYLCVCFLFIIFIFIFPIYLLVISIHTTTFFIVILFFCDIISTILANIYFIYEEKKAKEAEEAKQAKPD